MSHILENGKPDRDTFMCVVVGEQRARETSRGKYHIYFGTWYWRCLNWNRVENSEMKVKCGSSMELMVEAMGIGKIIKWKMYRWVERRKEKRKEWKTEGERPEKEEEEAPWTDWWDVNSLTQPEDSSISSYHGITGCPICAGLAYHRPPLPQGSSVAVP